MRYYKLFLTIFFIFTFVCASYAQSLVSDIAPNFPEFVKTDLNGDEERQMSDEIYQWSRNFPREHVALTNSILDYLLKGMEAPLLAVNKKNIPLYDAIPLDGFEFADNFNRKMLPALIEKIEKIAPNKPIFKDISIQNYELKRQNWKDEYEAEYAKLAHFKLNFKDE